MQAKSRGDALNTSRRQLCIRNNLISVTPPRGFAGLRMTSLARALLLSCLVALCLACDASPQTPTATSTATLTPTQTPTPTGFYVDANRSLGAVSRFALGTNHGPWAFVNEDVMPQFKASGISLIRFPGGNWGDENNLEAWQVDYFMTLARSINAEPLISARLRGGTPQQAVALLKYSKEKNYNVGYWSIGNGPSLYADYDSERYNQEWRTFALALKALDPNIILVGPDTHQFTGESSVDPKDKQGRDWLREFLKANGDLVDVVAVHRYPFPTQRGMGPPSLDALLSDTPRWDALVSNLRAVVRETTGKDKPIAITEFNSSWVGTVGRDPAKDTTLDSFNNALWLGDVLGRLIRQRVDMLAQFTLMSGSNIGGFGLLDRFDVRPSYYTYLMWKAFASELVFAQSDDAEVSLYAARNGDGLTLMLVNLSERAVTRPLRLDHFEVSGAAQVKVFDASHNATDEPTVKLSSASTYTVPAYSMTLLTITGKVSAAMHFPSITILSRGDANALRDVR